MVCLLVLLVDLDQGLARVKQWVEETFKCQSMRVHRLALQHLAVLGCVDIGPYLKWYTNPSIQPVFRPYFSNQIAPQAQYQSTFSANVGMQPSISAPPIATISQAGSVANLRPMFHIDPALSRDEWAELAKTKPCAFLQSLIISLAAPNPISTAGPSVEEAFKSHLVSLAPLAVQKDSQPISSLYSILKTFWLPSSPSYFSLTASASKARTPSEHRFLYWDPQPLVFNGISCPYCSVPLINRGRIRSGPMKIYDLEKPFFIIGCEYVCRSAACKISVSPEGRKLSSTDKSILLSLPTKLREEFPAYIMQGETDLGSGPNVWNWQAIGVSRSLYNMVRGCLNRGVSKDSILAIIKTIQIGFPDERKGEEEEDAEEEDELDQEQPSPQKVGQSAAASSENGTKDVSCSSEHCCDIVPE
jgi:hypothetical protein